MFLFKKVNLIEDLKHKNWSDLNLSFLSMSHIFELIDNRPTIQIWFSMTVFNCIFVNTFPESNLGMVSLEDYEYSAFRCAFCKVLNPSKKIRPKAPAIENIGSTIRSSSSTSSSSDKDSGSEGEEQRKTNSPTTGQLSSSTDVSQQQPSTSETSTEPTIDDIVQPVEAAQEKIIEENAVEEKSPADKKID